MALEEYMIPCMSKKIFGIDCFGCGSQRSLALIAKGEFTAAFQMYPAIYTTLLFFAFVALHFIYKSRSYQKWIIGLAIVNAVLMVGGYFYKLTN